MSAILPTVPIESDAQLAKYFLPYQVHWIQAEDALHAQGQQVYALAEKSIRIGWTYADAFKNVRKRLRFKNRDYLLSTKDYPSALEYMRVAYSHAELFDLTCTILSHGEEFLKVPRVDERGRSTGFTDEVKVGVIKFDNGSRILAFSAHPQAMAVYGGDVGLDEFAKHPQADLLWETAQGRITWGNDIAVWSSHDGEDTLFYQFAQQARAAFAPSLVGTSSTSSPLSLSPSDGKKPEVSGPGISSSLAPSDGERAGVRGSPNSQPSTTHSPLSPWNLYYRVTMPDAIELGLVETINQTRGTSFSREQFLANCKNRAGSDAIYQQAYLCNPTAGGQSIVEWSVIARCCHDYPIERLHLEHAEVLQLFGECLPCRQAERQRKILDYLHRHFPRLFNAQPATLNSQLRLGFDVAASGAGNLAVLYLDEVRGAELWLRTLVTCRTEDWHFLKTVLYCFLGELSSVAAAGDESGLSRQICWEAAKDFGSRFLQVSLATKKHDLGFALMNQLAVGEKRFPKDQPDIAADYFALRKAFVGKRWVFSETHNSYNPASHCDIAWAGALATEAHTQRKEEVWALVC